ncbi:MAG: TlpA family protein disulfide reductase [Ignavibacteriaceae bacterium]|nr:TlpA family protein disulfide reductase [Ignavibacteriaceae bacterium]
MIKQFVLFISLLLMVFASDGKKIASHRFETLEGKQAEIKSLLSKEVTIVTFWATWCKPCAEEMNEFQKLLDSYKDAGLKIIAISTDNERSIAKVKPFMKSKQFDFTVLLDTNGEAMRKFGVQSVPHTFIVSGDGTILYNHSGYSKGDEKKVEEIIKSKLKAGS